MSKWNLHHTGIGSTLLGRPAIEALNLPQRINQVKSVASGLQKRIPRTFLRACEIARRIQNTAYTCTIKERSWSGVEKATRTEYHQTGYRTNKLVFSELAVVPIVKGKIRLCVDLTKLDEGVKRENNFPLPLTDELLAGLAGEKIFTKLHCNSGFHQMLFTDIDNFWKILL